MTSEDFNKLTKEQLDHCMEILSSKAKEYATGDRLHNFKTAAILESCSPQQALVGMMAKHTICIYDMCMSGEKYTDEMWHEKITDNINYLLLLNSIIFEKSQK